jgi:Flp pilus assembly protein TadD
MICNSAVATSFEVSPNGESLAAEIATGWCIQNIGPPQKPVALGKCGDSRQASFSPDHRLVAIAGFGTAGAKVFDCQTGDLVADLPTANCGIAHFSPNNRWLATSPDGVRLWRTSDWAIDRQLNVLGTTPMGLGLAFSPDSRVLAAGQPNGVMRLIDPATGDDWAELSHPDLSCASFIAFTADQSRMIALGSRRQDRVRIFDLRAIRRQLAERDLDWPADVLHSPSPGDETTPLLRLEATLDDDGQFNKERAIIFWRKAKTKSGSAARDLLAQALALDSGNALMHNDLAWLLATGPAEVRDAESAVSHARQAVALDAARHQYHNTLGVALYRLERFSEAIVELNRSEELDSHNVGVAYNLIFLALGHARLGNREQAISCYARAARNLASRETSLAPTARDELSRFFKEAQALGLAP